MQVQKVTQANQQNSTNFKAIKSVKCEGLYKKYPQFAEKLVDTFQKNPVAMRFCKNNDVNIVFYACKKAMDGIESSIHIFFDNPAKKKFLGIFGSKEDKISLSTYDNKYAVEETLEKTTARLNDYISEHIPGKTSGLLNQHIVMKEEEMFKAAEQKAQKAQEALEEIEAKRFLKSQKERSDEALKESINKLIESSK